jgi:extradiol dioxygenase family protein
VGVCVVSLNQVLFSPFITHTHTHKHTHTHYRFQGQPGEQYTMFFKDPFNNNLEFKAMTNPDNLFAKYLVTEG